jgi:hypothetical protein
MIVTNNKFSLRFNLETFLKEQSNMAQTSITTTYLQGMKVKIIFSTHQSEYFGSNSLLKLVA